jgi:hypothetical protein
MPDDLDPQLLRLFADANAPFNDDEFHARVMARIARPPGWRGIAHGTAATLRAVGTGIAVGLSAPFRQRMSVGKLVAIALGALASCLVLLAV